MPTFTNRNNDNIEYVSYECSNPKQLIVISHGASEHILRYKDFALFLNKNNINVYGYNHLGHGNFTIEDNRGIYFSSNDGYQILINNLEDFCNHITKNNNLPLNIMGHSMGSTIVKDMLIQSTLTFNSIILSGSVNPKAILTNLGLLLSKGACILSGPLKINKTLNFLTFNDLTKKLSYNQENVINYQLDFNCGVPLLIVH